jgi:hypothetical protein
MSEHPPASEELTQLRTQYNLLRLEIADKVMALTELKAKIERLEILNKTSNVSILKKELNNDEY